jgi:hypothetical protein
MSKIDLIEKYPDISGAILSTYKEPATGFWVNDDIDLKRVWVPLPKPPDYTKIEGFGLPAREQKFKVSKMPKKLHDLERSGKSIDEIWETLQENYGYYREEILWIKLQIYRRINGYWFFNNGVPTYIDGWHYFFLNFWELDHGLPEYRERDWKFFHFCRMAYNDAYCYGVVYPKHRREGATSKAQCVNYCIVTYEVNAKGGIQSMTDDHAFTVFDTHLIKSWKRVPFFFKPNYDGNTSPKERLVFDAQAKRLSKSGSIAFVEQGLGSSIDFQPSNEKAYDSYKLYFYHHDEVGKTAKIDIKKRWKVVKQCLAQAGNIHGFSLHTSTVDEMEKGGGKQFFDFCKESYYDERDQNQQTQSGLYVLFIPATEGLEGYVDEYGNSVIEEPLPEQAAFLKERWIKSNKPAADFNPKQGSKLYFQNTRSALIAAGNHEALSENIRQFPTRFAECFRTETKGSGFNLTILENRIDELRHYNPFKVNGDFEWEIPGNRSSRVVWKPRTDGKGKFWLSKVLKDEESNHRYYDSYENTWKPTHKRKYSAGSDTFKFSSTKGRRKSNGGGAVFWNYDARLDANKPIQMWDSNRFVCTYSNRPLDKNEYGEDMLMMCVYFGCLMNPEINVPFIWDYFKDQGFEGFLMYKYDKLKQKFNDTPGDSSGEKVKQQIFRDYMDYIQNHGHREVHDEILIECKEIDGPADMKDFDLFTAGGYAFSGNDDVYNEIEKVRNEDNDLGNFFVFHSY